MISRDAGGRIGRINISGKKIKTPCIAIVVNPNKMTLSIKELKKTGVKLIITNAYIILRSKFREEIEEKGLHKFFKWKGLIYTDSGTYQMFSRNIRDIDNKTMVEFQEKIGSDFVTPVDVFTTPHDSYEEAEKKLTETIKRIREACELTKKLVCPIQGGVFRKLRKKACKELYSISPRVFAIGGIVPLMNSYDYSRLVDIVLTCKENLPSNIPVHAFGAGHPITFALLVACGVDIFDSAMYAIAAQENRYLTPYGTKSLDELNEFPCSCRVCSKYTPAELFSMEKSEKERILALHNLYVTLEEIKRIREAIRENSLWELLQIRARAHPKILFAFREMLKKHAKYFMEHDMFPKTRGLFYSGKETLLRPEIKKAKEKLSCVNKRKSKTIKLAPFGEIPKDLYPVYPFLHFEGFEEKKEIVVEWKNYFRLLLSYQFGKGAEKEIKDFELKFSKTGKPREVVANGKAIGIIHPETGFFIPNIHGALMLKRFLKKVFVKKEAEAYVKSGRDLLAKFAFTNDKIFSGEIVCIYNEENEVIACGIALLNSKEISEFNYGKAVKVKGTVH